MSRVLLLGAGGQLGMQLAKTLAAETELTALTRAELDFANPNALRAAIRAARPEIVINAAAYTAVDKAEQERELAHAVNAIAPGVIAEEVQRTKGWLVHYSTDYVFDGSGSKPWVETDATGPLSVYGQTKLDGERAIAATGCRHVTLRTSWVYAAEGRNFLHTMLRLGRERDRLTIVDDQIGAPTSAEAITTATRNILAQLTFGEVQAGASGVYHLACGGATSWFGFAKAIFAGFASQQKAPEVLPIPTEAYPTPARRPHNSRLNCSKLTAQFGIQMPHWEDALDEVTRVVLLKAETASKA
ncbi:dTDP-4-dehydrorhamnose reductase [Acidicapsa ligni]|uniref:dTDP-4-dehydrorhamnose reductase n=1 Tax=Acidicapsa ligni TaxID=542300 RepID=UPI0021E0C840|nr:dTDP-4-dehydrorhamnose reductase [Acidicapsa ligni]